MITDIKKLKALGISEERIKTFLKEDVSPPKETKPALILNVKREELEREWEYMVAEFFGQGVGLHEIKDWDWTLRAMKPMEDVLQKIESGELKYDPNRPTLYELVREEGVMLINQRDKVGDLYDQRVEETNKYKEENGLEWIDLETEYKIYEKFVEMMRKRVSEK